MRLPSPGNGTTRRINGLMPPEPNSAINDILAQHHQVRALCELMEQRRYGYDVIPIAGRKGL
ncbi:hypothetical protein [Phyllobacterium zundukense]|uniref:hypothetical protein n=1 Tax=Phyllobacterium zundukense TaxID=1867719 RepID=UPI00138FA551|nr:hypothetical protein [Phyllobacterium zundukense]